VPPLPKAIPQSPSITIALPFVKAMNSTVSAERAPVDLYGRVISGIEIPRAIVFESKPIAA